MILHLVPLLFMTSFRKGLDCSWRSEFSKLTSKKKKEKKRRKANIDTEVYNFKDLYSSPTI